MAGPIAVATVDLRRGEYVRGSMVVTFRAMRRLVWIAGAAFFLILAGAVASQFTSHPEPATSSFGFIGLVAVFLLVVAFGASSNYSKLPENRRHCEWRFFPDHIEVSSELGSSTFVWSTFVRASETRGLLVFFTQHNLVQIVPKRCFRSQAELDLVVSTCLRMLGPVAKLKDPGPSS